MILTLTAYQQAMVDYHAALNNTPSDEWVSQYFALFVTERLEPKYIADHTVTFQAALKDDATRDQTLKALTPVAVPVGTVTPPV